MEPSSVSTLAYHQVRACLAHSMGKGQTEPYLHIINFPAETVNFIRQLVPFTSAWEGVE